MVARSLEGAVVVVVGGGGGLGSPIVDVLRERGALVVRTARRVDGLAPLVDTVDVALDLRDVSAGVRLVEAVTRVHGRLDGVVNAAGVVAFGPLAQTPDDVLDELFAVNVVGPLRLVRDVSQMLIENKGFFVNVSAVVAEMPMAGMAAYSSSKAALTAADRALAREMRRVGVTVTDVRPPHTETGLVGRAVHGTAPKLAVGLDPRVVAERIVAAIEAGETDLATSAFSSAGDGAATTP